MNMASCNVCGKIFGVREGTVCPSCRKLLDIVYEKARTYLRDHPKAVNLKAPELASAIGEDLRLIEVLVAEGRFDSEARGDVEGEEDKRRRKLLAEIERSIATVREKAQPVVTYGKDRHGRDDA